MSIDEYSSSKKLDEEQKYPFENLDKIQVLQESRIFSEHKPNAKKCVHLISKILFLLGNGVILKKEESTGLFVKCTMLFGIKNKKLRRMLYVILKELSHSAEQTFIACSSLSTDMNRSDQKKFPFKANVIRTLRSISDLQTFISLERHFAEALVDQDPSVSSSSLISGLFISQINSDIIKRWTKQIVSCMKSRHHMTQYHALALMYKLQSHDHLSVSKLILNQSNSFKSPLAQCLLIKYTVKVLRKEGDGESDVSKKLLLFLDSCLDYKNEMIILEASKALTSLSFIKEERVKKVVNAIQTNLLTSRFEVSKSVASFAGLRILNKLAGKYPKIVFKCSSELEKMIKNSNKNISTLAISALLKCSSSSFDMAKLTKEINTFMGDITDDYKINVIESIKALIPRSPKHHGAILTFLNKIFTKIEAGYDVKSSVVKTIIAIIENNKKVLNQGIIILCEFIEDCEYDRLLQEIIYFLGQYGPLISNPSTCIRYIYNRLFLESASVRAASVESLYTFGVKVKSLRKSIIIILKRILDDNNDIVRDDVLLAIKNLEDIKVPEVPEEEDKKVPQKKEDSIAEIEENLLEKNLLLYLSNDALSVDAFDVNNMKEEEKEKQEEIKRMQDEIDNNKINEKDTSIIYNDLIEKIPQFKDIGKPFKICKDVLLTEKEGDYVVKCTKRIYEKVVVLHFSVQNNVKTQKLSSVGVEIDVDDINGLSSSFGIQATSISYEEVSPVLICLNLEKGTLPVGKMISNLTFKIYEDDLDEEDFEENEYELEELDFVLSDFLKSEVNPNFKEEWKVLDTKNEHIRKVEFPKSYNLYQAVQKTSENIGLTPLNEVNYKDIKKNKKKDQALYYCVKTVSNEKVLMAAKIFREKGKYKSMLYVRSNSKDLRTLVAEKLFK